MKQKPLHDGSTYMSLLAVIATVAAVSVLYLFSGDTTSAGGEPQHQESYPSSSRPAETGTSIASVNQLLGGLEQRLRDDPNDAKGWLLLARSYDHLDRFAEAIDAYEKARALGASDMLLESRLFQAALTSPDQTNQ